MVIQNRKKFSSKSPNSLNTPVLFLIFNRPNTTRQVFSAIKKAKPATVKGVYMKKVTLSSTMGPGIKIDYEKSL